MAVERGSKVISLDEFIKRSTCAHLTVEASKAVLRDAGFVELKAGEAWNLELGGRYYVDLYDTTLIAFTTGAFGRINIAAAHTDFPGFRIKYSPENVVSGYGTLNVEGYGGAILNSWYDRPVGISGKIYLRSASECEPEEITFDSGGAVGIIPNLAIHMNRDVNNGTKVTIGKDMQPVIMMNAESNFFNTYLAEAINRNPDDILDYDLFVYNCDAPMVVGAANDMYLAPRLDNLTSVYACLKGIVGSSNKEAINLIALFDNEEIGSATKQGAGSQVMSMMIEKLFNGLGADRNDMINAFMNGYMLSVDVAHALHPNRPEKSDTINKVILNRGFVIKTGGAYAYDGKVISIIKEICRKNDIPFQIFTKQADSRGGSTLGAISNTMVPIRTLDVGVPLLAMHSARETMGKYDQQHLEELIVSFFTI